MSAFNDHQDELNAEWTQAQFARQDARIAELEAENAQLRSSNPFSIFAPTPEQDALQKLSREIGDTGRYAYVSPALQAEICERLAKVTERSGMTVAIADILVDALGEITMLKGA